MNERTGKNCKFLTSLKMPLWGIFSFPFIFFLINTVKIALVYNFMNFNTGICNHYYSQDPGVHHPKGLLGAISL